MRQLHIVPSISKSHGGLGVAAFEYAISLARAGYEITLLSLRARADDLDLDHESLPFDIARPESDSLSSVITLIHGKLQQTYDFVHIHGMWVPALSYVAFICRLRGIPYAISPHGSVEHWALDHKKFKKQLGLFLYQRDALTQARLLFATSKQEAESIRQLGLKNPVALVPVGINPVASVRRLSSDVFTILFLSRIDPKKGLPMLLMAFESLRLERCRLIVAGSGDLEYMATLEELVKRLNIEDKVEFTGMVSGRSKEEAFSTADLFILPSYSENFGIVIAEALVRGVPVITTTATPWEAIGPAGCGWCVPPRPDAIAKALREAVNTDKARLREMGDRGVEYIAKSFSWESIARQAVSCYEWANGSVAPSEIMFYEP